MIEKIQLGPAAESKEKRKGVEFEITESNWHKEEYICNNIGKVQKQATEISPTKEEEEKISTRKFQNNSPLQRYMIIEILVLKERILHWLVIKEVTWLQKSWSLQIYGKMRPLSE